MTAIWTDKSGSTFTVLPAEVDIPPFKSTSFRVNFHPQDPNKFYGADLECVTFYKVLKNMLPCYIKPIKDDMTV